MSFFDKNAFTMVKCEKCGEEYPACQLRHVCFEQANAKLHPPKLDIDDVYDQGLSAVHEAIDRLIEIYGEDAIAQDGIRILVSKQPSEPSADVPRAVVLTEESE